MKVGSIIWRLGDTVDSNFARATRIGYWNTGCEDTNSMTMPFVIEWLRGGTRLPDFLWPGFDDDLVVALETGQELCRQFRGLEMLELVQKGAPRLTRSEHEPSNARAKKESRDYQVLWIKKFVTHDVRTTTANIIVPSCGNAIKVVLEGIESTEVKWIPEKAELFTKPIPREPGKGLFVRQRVLGKSAIFRVRQWPRWIFCTQDGRDYIEEKEYTNIRFREAGNVI